MRNLKGDKANGGIKRSVLREVRGAGVRESQALEEGAAERTRGLLLFVILGSGLVKKITLIG